MPRNPWIAIDILGVFAAGAADRKVVEASVVGVFGLAIVFDAVQRSLVWSDGEPDKLDIGFGVALLSAVASANAIISLATASKMWMPLGSWSPTWRMVRGCWRLAQSMPSWRLPVTRSKPPDEYTAIPYGLASRANCGTMPAA